MSTIKDLGMLPAAAPLNEYTKENTLSWLTTTGKLFECSNFISKNEYESLREISTEIISAIDNYINNLDYKESLSSIKSFNDLFPLKVDRIPLDAVL